MTAPTSRRPGARPPVVPAGPKLAARARVASRDRRTTLVRRTGLALAGVVPLALLGWLLLSSSWFAVRQVSVSGESRLTGQQVLAAAGVVPGTPLARLDTAAIAGRVRRLAPVAAVSVTRDWPHGVRLRVTERQAVAGVLQGSAITLLDARGVAFASGGSFPPGVVTLAVAQPGPGDPSTRAALAVLDVLPAALRSQLRSLSAASPEQVQLLLRDGRTVVWGGAEGAAQKVPAVVALLTLPGTVFDVSAPGVVTRR